MGPYSAAAVRSSDPGDLSYRQLSVLGTSAARELGWGLRGVSAELEGWQARAHAIPDPTVRHDAVTALASKRLLVDGAALFWILPRRRRPELLRLLVAFQTLANLVDHLSERTARERSVGAASPTAVLLDAVDVDRPITALGAVLGGADDGGYVRALVEACRAGCTTLPRYGAARTMLVREAGRARSFDIEHDPDPRRRSIRMRQFASSEFGDAEGATWWEVVAGASSLLTSIVLLALAADERTTEEDLRRAVAAYAWAARVSALLDNYVDHAEDALVGAHNYLAYYPEMPRAVQRIAFLVERSVRDAGALHDGRRHLVIVASMVAMFLSRDSARSPALRAGSDTLAAHGGALTRLLIPILRAWRVAYREQAG